MGKEGAKRKKDNDDDIARVGEILVRKDPALVALEFAFWQFGKVFSKDLLEWWEGEVHANGPTYRWFIQVWPAQEATMKQSVQIGLSYAPGTPSWQLQYELYGRVV